MKTTEVASYRVSPRCELNRGDLFRLVGGPVYRDADGKAHVLRLPGVFEFRGTLLRGRRVWIECVGVTATAGFHTVFVAGRPYRRFGLLHKPFRVKRVRKTLAKAYR